ncbi:MAG: M13 family metallopeptidase [Rhodanobacteraceae bacterium]|nr:M13 family metallopeptidase [Xanthomonadales bacterium]MCP5478389.1 M13 family metallopeptidase [Rhodanobacteraceae bacterium]HPF74183.1 M13 family metallopeptidase [Xanthomonadaceae bacterium]HRX99307.1 M13 family metallopeptidase [Xanthomonadaceae bacterium]
MSRIRLLPLAAALGLALTASASAAEHDWLKPGEFDRDTAACQDLNQRVNGPWLAANPVPGDHTTWGTFEILGERSLETQREIVEAAAKSDAAKGSIQQKIGDLYGSGMDADALNKAGVAPLKPYLAEVDAINSPEALGEWIRRDYSRGFGSLFGFFGTGDFKDSSQVIAYAAQGGLSLPEKAYYLEDKEDYVKIRKAFVEHVAKMLELGGVSADDATKQAKDVLAFETELAKHSLSPIELRDPSKFYNPVSVADADKITPHFSWSAFFDANGVAQPKMFSLAQPDFFAAIDKMMTETPLDSWKAYLRYNTINSAAPFLSDAVSEESFNFYGKALRGQEEQRPRWKRVLSIVNGVMGEALGQLYVAKVFPPESKAAALELVNNLSAALKVRLENLDWMGPETKKKALEKWASFTPKIGYPDKWRDWSDLDIRANDYLGNAIRASAFEHQFQMAKIGKPVDRSEWGMSPQTVNAYYNPQMNEVVFPAAILQPPFFDALADPALNYGGIGAVIGHEMLHGYDDQGSQFDAKGNFDNWWTADDRKKFEERTAKLVNQFDNYVAIDGLHVKGELTLGENIADLGGLTVAYDAFHKATENMRLRPINGMTPDQRFFANWAVVWRRNFKPEELKVRLNTDPHAPANFRAIGAPSNMPNFAHAYECVDGDKMVRPEADRVVIW